MAKTIINIPECPDYDLPLSRVVAVGDLLFLSGMVSIDMKSGLPVLGSIEDETKQVIDNIEKILSSIGSSLDNVIKSTVFLRNIDDFKRMNQVYEERFSSSLPARSTVGISLAGEFLIEIEVIACRV